MDETRRIQIQLPVPYKREPRDDEQVRSYLDRGYRILQYQRLSDAEVVVTLEVPAGAPPRGSGDPVR